MNRTKTIVKKLSDNSEEQRIIFYGSKIQINVSLYVSQLFQMKNLIFEGCQREFTLRDLA